MRATRAYITSFGTTGLLIASALLTLAVMSAFVAFNGFPGQDVQDPIGTLLVQERQAPVHVPARPVKVRVLGARRSAAAARARHSGTRTTTGPLAHVSPVKTHSGSPLSPTTQAPGSGGNGQQSSVPQQPAPTLPQSPVSTTTPSLPSGTLPSLPTVTIPITPPPPPPGGDTQLPVDTSGITGILGSP